MFFKPCGVKLLTKDVNYDLSSLFFNKCCFFQVNFLINAAFENAAFIREWCLFHISLPKYGVYWRAAFIRGQFLKEEIRRSILRACVLQALYYGGGGLRGGGDHTKCSQTERGDQQFFCCFQGGIKNLIESFIPFLPHPSPPRELKNDNSLSKKFIAWLKFQVFSPFLKAVTEAKNHD